MIRTAVVPFLDRVGKGPDTPRGVRPIPPTAWSSANGHPVEIVSHDRSSADLLIEYATSLFPAEIVSGSSWIVRLQPPVGGGWVLEFLSLVERWLESARLPCAKVLYGGRSYLIRTSTDNSTDRAAAASLSAEALTSQPETSTS